MFRFWKEESEDARELAAADHRLRGEDDAPESDAAGSRTPESDQGDFDKSPPLLAGDGQEPVAPQPAILARAKCVLNLWQDRSYHG